MPQIRTKIENKTIAWDARRRFRVGSSCEYNGSSWVNVTGGNSEPGVGNDWVKKEGSGGSLMIHPITVETAGPNQVFNLPDTFSQIQLVNSRVPLTKGTEWEEMFPNQVKIITELEIGDALEVHFWKRGSNNSESYTKAESEARNKETFNALKSVNTKLSFATEPLAQSYWAGLTAQEQTDINLQEFNIETGNHAGVNKWDSNETNGTKFLRGFIIPEYLSISTDKKTYNRFLSGFQYQTAYYSTAVTPQSTFKDVEGGKEIDFKSSTISDAQVNFVAQTLAPTNIKLGYEYTLTSKIEALNSATPAITIGFYDPNDLVTPVKSIAYRSGGSVFYLNGDAVSLGLQRADDTQYAFAANDVISIKLIVASNGTLSIVTTKNGVKSPLVEIPVSVTVTEDLHIGIGSRGMVKVTTYLEENKTFKKGKTLTSQYVNAIPNSAFLDGLNGWEGMPIGVNSTDNSLVEDSNPFSSKARKATGRLATSNSNFSGIAIKIANYFKPGDKVVFRGLIKKSFAGDNPYIEFRAKDVALATLDTVTKTNITTEANAWEETGEIEMTLPANTEWIFVFARDWSINETVSMVGWTLTKKESGLESFYIANRFNSSGLKTINVDSNNSFASAISELNGGSGVIVVAEGDYREPIDFSSFASGNVRIVGKPNSKIRVLGSEKLTFSKTAGYTNIYEASFNGVFPSREIIYEDGRWSKPILDSERHPLQKSLTHRLPFTHIIKKTLVTDLATTLAALDAEAGKYYFDGSKVYIHTTDSDDPTINGHSYEVPQREPATPSPDGSTVQIELENISFCFSSKYGLNTGKAGTVIRKNIRVIGADDDGIKDDANTVISYNDEVMDTRDGINGHFNRVTGWDIKDSRYGKSIHYYFGQWSHDNTDDGNSHHERGQIFTFGCLFEYNQKSGFAPSNTCQWEDHNSICRQNKGNATFGEGVEVINSVIGNDDGVGVVFIGFGTVCENNRKGFRSAGSGNKMILHNCISRNNDDFEYEADGGNIYANNCKVTNASVAKYKNSINSGSIITVKDEDLL